MQGKKLTGVDDLSARDRAVLDLLADNTAPKLIAEQFGISRQRVQQIAHHPVSQAYLARLGGKHRTLLYARAGGELLARMDWGGVKLADLLAIWRAAMPQEVLLRVEQAEIDAAAARLAARTGVAKERAVVDIRARLNRKAG